MAHPRRAPGRHDLGVSVRRLALAALILAIAGCSTTATPSPSPSFPPVRVSNRTSVAVTLVVNGSAVAVIAAGGVADPVASRLPARPWAIQLESPSGRPLVTLYVPAGAITVGVHGMSNNLACGEIELAVADPLSSGGGPFSPGPGASPCD